MQSLEERRISCPYCGEPIDVLIDLEGDHCEYIEDCQVCCRPITFVITADHTGEVMVSVHDENDAY